MNSLKSSTYGAAVVLFIYTFTFNIAYNADFSQSAVPLTNLEHLNAVITVEKSLKLVESAASSYYQAVHRAGDLTGF